MVITFGSRRNHIYAREKRKHNLPDIIGATVNMEDISHKKVFVLFHNDELFQKLYRWQINAKVQRETSYKLRRIN